MTWNSTFKDKPTKPLKRTPFKTRQKPLGATKPRSVSPKRGKGLKRARTDTIGKLKAKLWQLCRAIIISKYGSDCYTCPARNLMGSNRHIGHFISSSVSSAEMRYSLDNLRPQCYRCNIHLSGNWISYEAHLIQDGVDVVELKHRNQITKGMQADRIFYQNKILEYESLKRELETI